MYHNVYDVIKIESTCETYGEFEGVVTQELGGVPTKLRLVNK
jgi:hypothetical protein